jgi:serine/threonine protein phosphatase PrpC
MTPPRTRARPLAFSLQNTRQQNEDALFPPAGTATDADTLFLVCDGVGGAARGEVASQLACQHISTYLRTAAPDVVTEADVRGAVVATEAAFDAYLDAHPGARGMGTTLALLALDAGGATLAHLGDSRVYQFRAGRIRWRTRDHSLVNQLLDAGVLQPEEVPHFSQRNVITRAIQGQSVQVAEPEVQRLTDVQPGDVFLLCTDGVLETLTDATLEALIGATTDEARLLDHLRAACAHHHDNATAYLIRLVGGAEPEVPHSLFSLFRA